MTFNTGNNVPSTSPRDLYDNAENLDKLVNGAEPFYPDRLGKLRESWAGMESEHDAAQLQRSGEFDSAQTQRADAFDADQASRSSQFEQMEGEFSGAQSDRASEFDATQLEYRQAIRDTGLQVIGDYSAGIEFTDYNQAVRLNGEFWKPSASTVLPYTTTGAGMPESGAFVAVGDAVLRQELTNPDKGAAMIGTIFGGLASLLALIMGGRKYTSATFAAAMPDGSIFTMGGLQYLVDSSATGPDSCTNDLGVDGIRPFGTVCPQHFGAVADGSITDDHVAIQRAIDYSYSTGGRVSLGSLSYRIDDRVVVKGSFDGSNATLNVYGSPDVAFDISTGNGDDPTDLLSLSRTVEIIVPNLVNKTKPNAGWEGQGIGCRAHNVHNARVRGQVVQEFAVGLKLSAKSQGCSYGKASDFFFLNNQRNFETEQLDDTGWVTEWSVNDSRFFHYSVEGTEVVGTRHVNIIPHPTSYIVNNIRFYNPCLEGETPEYHLYLGGTYIQFYGSRFENAGGARIHLASAGVPGQGSANQIVGGRGVDFNRFKFSKDPGARERFTINGSDVTDLSIRGGGDLLKNTSGSYADSPLLMGFSATTPVVSDEFDATTQYSWNLYALGMDGKRDTDAYPRMSLNFQDASILLGGGTAAPVGGMVAIANAGVDLIRPYLPIVTTTPPSAGGRAALWFDGESIKIRLPDGTIKTISTEMDMPSADASTLKPL